MSVTTCIGIPTYNQQVGVGTMSQIITAISEEAEAENGVEVRIGASSLLCQCFNTLWAQVLNSRAKSGRPDYFLMMHADIVPIGAGWLAKLRAEMQRGGFDVLSAVAPIKSRVGNTSTAVGLKDQPFGPKRLLSMREIFALPETFGPEILARDDLVLMGNTGLMLVDMARPFWREVRFHIDDTMGVLNDQLVPVVQSEDWNFFCDAQALGAKVGVTRVVPLEHVGIASFGTSEPWGREVGEDDAARQELPISIDKP